MAEKRKRRSLEDDSGVTALNKAREDSKPSMRSLPRERNTAAGQNRKRDYNPVTDVTPEQYKPKGGAEGVARGVGRVLLSPVTAPIELLNTARKKGVGRAAGDFVQGLVDTPRAVVDSLNPRSKLTSEERVTNLGQTAMMAAPMAKGAGRFAKEGVKAELPRSYAEAPETPRQVSPKPPVQGPKAQTRMRGQQDFDKAFDKAPPWKAPPKDSKKYRAEAAEAKQQVLDIAEDEAVWDEHYAKERARNKKGLDYMPPGVVYSKLRPVQRDLIDAARKKEVGPERKVPDTRGQQQQYHGTPLQIGQLDPTHPGDPSNFYGPGLYTTDARDVAHGYANKWELGSKRARIPERGAVYKVKSTKKKLFDLDSPTTPEFQEVLRQVAERAPTNTQAMFANHFKRPSSTPREFYDLARDLSPSSYPHIFRELKNRLQERGYTGLAHEGGRRTNTDPHRVEVYWNVEDAHLEDPGPVPSPAKDIARKHYQENQRWAKAVPGAREAADVVNGRLRGVDSRGVQKPSPLTGSNPGKAPKSWVEAQADGSDWHALQAAKDKRGVKLGKAEAAAAVKEAKIQAAIALKKKIARSKEPPPPPTLAEIADKHQSRPGQPAAYTFGELLTDPDRNAPVEQARRIEQTTKYRDQVGPIDFSNPEQAVRAAYPGVGRNVGHIGSKNATKNIVDNLDSNFDEAKVAELKRKEAELRAKGGPTAEAVADSWRAHVLQDKQTGVSYSHGHVPRIEDIKARAKVIQAQKDAQKIRQNKAEGNPPYRGTPLDRNATQKLNYPPGVGYLKNPRPTKANPEPKQLYDENVLHRSTWHAYDETAPGGERVMPANARRQHNPDEGIHRAMKKWPDVDPQDIWRESKPVRTVDEIWPPKQPRQRGSGGGGQEGQSGSGGGSMMDEAKAGRNPQGDGNVFSNGRPDAMADPARRAAPPADEAALLWHMAKQGEGLTSPTLESAMADKSALEDNPPIPQEVNTDVQSAEMDAHTGLETGMAPEHIGQLRDAKAELDMMKADPHAYVAMKSNQYNQMVARHLAHPETGMAAMDAYIAQMAGNEGGYDKAAALAPSNGAYGEGGMGSGAKPAAAPSAPAAAPAAPRRAMPTPRTEPPGAARREIQRSIAAPQGGGAEKPVVSSPPPPAKAPAKTQDKPFAKFPASGPSYADAKAKGATVRANRDYAEAKAKGDAARKQSTSKPPASKPASKPPAAAVPPAATKPAASIAPAAKSPSLAEASGVAGLKLPSSLPKKGPNIGPDESKRSIPGDTSSMGPERPYYKIMSSPAAMAKVATKAVGEAYQGVKDWDKKGTMISEDPPEDKRYAAAKKKGDAARKKDKETAKK